MARVDKGHDEAKVGAGLEVFHHDLVPGVFHGLGHFGETVAGQIDKVEFLVDVEEIQRLGFAGGAAGLGEALAVEEGVEQA